jgi:signal transduction histidine kinase
MPVRHFVFLWVFAVSCACISMAQTNRITVLKKKVEQAGTMQEKLAAILTLCEETESLNDDTLLHYATEAKTIASSQKNSVQVQLASYYEAYALYRKGMVDSSFAITTDHLSHADPSLYFRFSFLKARSLMRKRQYKEALAQYYESLNKAEQQKDTLNQMRAMSGIGWALEKTEDNSGSLNWFLKGIRLSDRPEYRNKTIYLYTNAAAMFNALGQRDSADIYVRKAIQYAREAENLIDQLNSLGLYAGNLMDMGRVAEAEKPLQETIAIAERIGDPNEIISDMGTLAVYYANTGQPQKGIDLSLKAIAMTKQHRLLAKLPFLYDVLGRNYSAAGRYKEYGETLEQLMTLKDSLYQQNSAEALAEMKTKYEVQKKENTIIRQQLDLVKKDYLIYSSVLLLLLAALSGYLVFRNYKKRQQLKAAMAVAAAEENERKRIAADLHDNLGAYAASIASNVNRISLPDGLHTAALQELQHNSNAIVADLSDTIWALKREALALTTISDRLKIFIQRVQASYPGVSIDVDEQIVKDHLLSPSQGFHLFQAVQEAINNALRHSQGRHIIITVEGKEKEWKISVSDDGIGMQPLQENKEGGNGLFNMKNRAAEAGWAIEWGPNIPSGTVVSMQNRV